MSRRYGVAPWIPRRYFAVTSESWKSAVGSDLAAFLEWRRLAGYQFRVQERWLHQFDHYCADRSLSQTELTSAVFEAFVQRPPTESLATRQARMRLLSQWAEYLRDHGMEIEALPYPHLAGRCEGGRAGSSGAWQELDHAAGWRQGGVAGGANEGVA